MQRLFYSIIFITRTNCRNATKATKKVDRPEMGEGPGTRMHSVPCLPVRFCKNWSEGFQNVISTSHHYQHVFCERARGKCISHTAVVTSLSTMLFSVYTQKHLISAITPNIPVFFHLVRKPMGRVKSPGHNTTHYP